MNMDVTFLTKEQIWGNNIGFGQLSALEQYGSKTGISDLAVLLGGRIDSSDNETCENQPTGHVWSASNYHNLVTTINYYGDSDLFDPNDRHVSSRPALPSSVTREIKPSELKYTKKIGNVQVVEYGEYPQAIATDDITEELEFRLSKFKESNLKLLKTTGKTYTFDGEKNDEYVKPFKAKKYVEYQLDDRRYIRVEAQPIPLDSESVLSNGLEPIEGKAYWVEVQPIEWLRDPTGIMIARQALFAGIQFDCKETYDGDFNKTDIKHYLDTCFAKEMQVSRAVDSPSAVINPTTVTLSEHRAAQRQRALNDTSQGL